ncbi:MAG: hypothetical protein ACYTXT_33365 [Nostoc sp.]
MSLNYIFPDIPTYGQHHPQTCQLSKTPAIFQAKPIALDFYEVN